MAVDERTMHELYLRLAEVLDVEQAATLMSHLPRPAGATSSRGSTSTSGCPRSRPEIDARLDGIDTRLDSHDARFGEMLRRLDAQPTGNEQRIDAMADRLTAAFRGELNQAVVAQSRLLIVALFTALAPVAGVMFGVVQLAG